MNVHVSDQAPPPPISRLANPVWGQKTASRRKFGLDAVSVWGHSYLATKSRRCHYMARWIDFLAVEEVDTPTLLERQPAGGIGGLVPGGSYTITAVHLTDLSANAATAGATFTHLNTTDQMLLLAYQAPTDTQPEAQPAYGLTTLFQGRTWHADLGMYSYRARWYLPEMGEFGERDPFEYLDFSNSFDGLGSNPANFIDPLGLRLFGHPYNFLTGAQAHYWFSGWIAGSPWGMAQRKLGRTILVNRSLGVAVGVARKGPAQGTWRSPTGVLVKRTFRPDAMSVGEHGQGGEVLKLKPETWRVNVAKRDAAVLKVAAEVRYLAAHGVHVEPGEVVRSMPEAARGVPIEPSVVLDIDGSLYSMVVVAPLEGEAPGVVFYRLLGGKDLDPSQVKEWARVLAPKLHAVETAEGTAEAVVKVLIAAGALTSQLSKYVLPALEEFGVAATEGAAAMTAPVVILPPCFLQPGAPCGDVGTIPGA